jgi:hypothetical protein
MGVSDQPRLEFEIVFVSPDGSKSAPMTLEEIQRRSQERGQSSSSANAMSEEG